MKKLLLLLIIPLLFACSKDGDEKIVYLDNRLIEGDWYRIDYSDSLVYRFINGRAEEVRIDRYTLYESSKHNYFSYKISANVIYFSWKNWTMLYKLDNDTLTLKEADNTDFVDYYRAK